MLLSFPWTNGQSAEFVVGQPDFTSNGTACSVNGLNFPSSCAIDYANSKLYICDYLNSRVLRFGYPLTSNQPNAEMVFGQPDFTSNAGNRGGGPSANSLFMPIYVIVHNGNLWVADMVNNRILRWSNAYSASIDAGADLVLGQPNFTSNSSANTISGLNYPQSLSIDDSGNLWVIDLVNTRVLMFSNCESKSNGANADKVLGQSDFTSNVSGLSDHNFDFSYGLNSVTNFGSTLWVSDGDNNRVLRFDNASSKSNGASADGVLGQVDYVSGSINRGGSAGANTLNNPAGMFVDQNGDLYITDALNNRVVIYCNASTKSNGASADYVLGQPDFFITTSGLTASKFYMPSDVKGDLTSSNLLIVDLMNSRVLKFYTRESISTLPEWAVIITIGFLFIIGVRYIWKAV